MKINKNAFEKFDKVKQGQEAIDEIGHRRYVGGVGKNWHEIGRLQFKFLIEQGLTPKDVLLDIACGSLRAGIHIIPYLDKKNYLGIDKEPHLIKAGREIELGKTLEGIKSPEFQLSDDFNYSGFSKKPNFAIAQSLFTHLPPPMIIDCFQKTFDFMESGGRFFATYFVSKNELKNPEVPHDRLGYFFTKDKITSFGKETGWNVNFIGEWNHPRGQQIVEYIKP